MEPADRYDRYDPADLHDLYYGGSYYASESPGTDKLSETEEAELTARKSNRKAKGKAHLKEAAQQAHYEMTEQSEQQKKTAEAVNQCATKITETRQQFTQDSAAYSFTQEAEWGRLADFEYALTHPDLGIPQEVNIEGVLREFNHAVDTGFGMVGIATDYVIEKGESLIDNIGMGVSQDIERASKAVESVTGISADVVDDTIRNVTTLALLAAPAKVGARAVFRGAVGFVHALNRKPTVVAAEPAAAAVEPVRAARHAMETGQIIPTKTTAAILKGQAIYRENIVATQTLFARLQQTQPNITLPGTFPPRLENFYFACQARPFTHSQITASGNKYFSGHLLYVADPVNKQGVFLIQSQIPSQILYQKMGTMTILKPGSGLSEAQRMQGLFQEILRVSLGGEFLEGGHILEGGESLRDIFIISDPSKHSILSTVQNTLPESISGVGTFPQRPGDDPMAIIKITP